MIEEGYTKYKQHFTEQALSNYTKVLHDLSESRRRMYDLGLIGAYENGIGFGNISAKLDGQGFIISATQTGEIPNLGKDDFSKVYKYDIASNEIWSEGKKRASSESLTHAAVYELDSSIRAVIHIHSLQLWKKHIRKLPTTSADVTYGTPEMANEVFRLYKSTDLEVIKIFVMGGHEEGIVAFGKSLTEAEKLIESL